MRDFDDDPKCSIAIHEAGHIVVAMHWGVPVTTATIIPVGEDLGSATHEPVVDWFEWPEDDGYCRELAVRDMSISYAGAVAADGDVSKGDWASIVDAIKDYVDATGADLSEEQEQEVRDEAWSRAEDVVRLTDAVLKRYARALLRHGSLTEKQIRRIWLDATAAKLPRESAEDYFWKVQYTAGRVFRRCRKGDASSKVDASPFVYQNVGSSVQRRTLEFGKD